MGRLSAPVGASSRHSGYNPHNAYDGDWVEAVEGCGGGRWVEPGIEGGREGERVCLSGTTEGSSGGTNISGRLRCGGGIPCRPPCRRAGGFTEVCGGGGGVRDRFVLGGRLAPAKMVLKRGVKASTAANLPFAPPFGGWARGSLRGFS